jgi:hypothetical protein
MCLATQAGGGRRLPRHPAGPRRVAAGLALACAAAATTLAAATATATPDAPPPAHTAGFGEPSCQACHLGAGDNEGPGTLELIGLPAEYEPGASYVLTVRLTQTAMPTAGFQLAIRHADGAQAGNLTPAHAEERRIGVTVSGDVQYAHHLIDGTVPAVTDTAEWRIRWTAPAAARGLVLIHAAALAANDDLSPLGDWVYSGNWARKAKP